MAEVVRDFTHVLKDSQTVVITWSGLDGDDSGKAAQVGKYRDRTVEVHGTFGGATVTIYGTSDPRALTDRAAGTAFGSKTASWKNYQDTTETSVTFTAAGSSQLLQNFLYMLPVVTGGDGTTSLEIIVTAGKDE